MSQGRRVIIQYQFLQAPDVDVGLGQGREHRGGDSLARGHLVPDRRQHAAVVYLLHLADAARLYCIRKPAELKT